MQDLSPLSDGERQIVRQFGELYWRRHTSTFFSNTFLGVPCFQNPFDAWVTQELIFEVKRDRIVECGSFAGGSALLWASALAQVGDGRVVAVDANGDLHQAAAQQPLWDRIDWITGSSVDPAVLDDVRQRCAGRRTLVILDSDHAAEHVEAELHAYADLVDPGSYLIVQDGFVSDLDPDHGPGPLEATRAFLERDDRFEVDRSRERMLFTFNPSGFLRRTDPS